MEKLKVFLNSLTTAKQREFAQRVGTSVNYLRKAICRKQQLGAGFCIAIERESGGAVRCEDLQPSVDWAFLRTGPARGTQPALLAEGRR